MVAKYSMDPSLAESSARTGSDHRLGTSKQHKAPNPLPATNIQQGYSDIRTSSSLDQPQIFSERLDTAHPVLSSGLECLRRSPSPGPKISAETKARWTMLKLLAGVSQPHDVEEEDRNEDRDLEMHNKGVDMRNGEETGVRDSSHSGAYADDASIKRYLQNCKETLMLKVEDFKTVFPERTHSRVRLIKRVNLWLMEVALKTRHDQVLID